MNSAQETPFNIHRRPFNKVFGIGFNKTATTTLETIFRHIGLLVPNQQQQERAIALATYRGDYGPFYQFVSQFEAFQDRPFSTDQVYIAADSLFPKSKFILTVRDSEKWFRSFYRFCQKFYGIDDLRKLGESGFRKHCRYLMSDYVWENEKRFLTTFEKGQKKVRWDLLFDEAFYREQFDRRNTDIRKYFDSRPLQFLEIDLTTEPDTTRIIDFLSMSKDKITPMPHENATQV